MNIPSHDFIAALAGDVATPMHWRALKPDGKARRLIGTLADKCNELESLNADGFGIYVVVNSGGNKDEDITECRAVFVDIDAKAYDDPATGKGGNARLKQIAGDLFKLLAPSIVVKTSKRGLHLYWVLDTPISPEEFEEIQRGLAKRYDTDPAVVNASRIMRVPGFKNTKPTAGDFVAELLHHSDVRYSVNQIRDALLPTVAESPATHFNPATNAALIGISQEISIEKLAAMGAFVTEKSAGAYYKSKGADKKGYPLWRDAVLLPLKSEAAKRVSKNEAIKSVFDLVSSAFGGNCDPDRNDVLWESTNAFETSIATFIAIANHAGYVDTAAKREQAQDLVTEFNERYAFCDISGKIAIIGEQYDAARKIHKRVFYNTHDFKDKHGEAFCYLDENGNKRQTTEAKYWLTSPLRRKFNNVAFMPSGDVPPETFNLWRGFAVEPRAGDCTEFTSFVRDVICAGDVGAFKVLMQWAAHLVQRPGEKPSFAIVLIGGEGAGKGFFVNAIGSLLGSHYLPGLDEKALTGNFNAELDGVLLGFADEVSITAKDGNSERFKKVISENTLRIEPKGVNAFTVVNFARFVIATNREHAVPASLDARRFFVLRVSNARQGDTRHFGMLQAWLENGGREALMHHLAHEVDISDFNPRVPPITEALRTQKRLSLTPMQSWIAEKLESAEWWDAGQNAFRFLPTGSLLASYQAETNQRGTSEAIASAVRATMPSAARAQNTQQGVRQRGFALPSIEIARREFQENTGITLRIPEEAEN